MSDGYEQKYTRPELRREIKDDLMQSDRGGRPGQWSARKAQLLVQEYERRGGGYKEDRKDEDAKSLEEWTNQDWQTGDGSAYADRGDGMKRYLPKDAWELLSPEEKRRAEKKKQAGNAEGKQFVENTVAAKAARAYVDHGDASDLGKSQLKRLSKKELLKLAREVELPGRSKLRKEELAEQLFEHFQTGLEHQSQEDLYKEAQEKDIAGRSQMNKAELRQAVREERR